MFRGEKIACLDLYVFQWLKSPFQSKIGTVQLIFDVHKVKTSPMRCNDARFNFSPNIV